jgi:hypothetical protein
MYTLIIQDNDECEIVKVEIKPVDPSEALIAVLTARKPRSDKGRPRIECSPA